MAYESTASKTTAVFTPDSGVAITFCYTDVTMSEYALDPKLDISTNCDTLGGSDVGPKSYVPAGLYEIGNFSLTIPNDLGKIDDLRQVLGQAGTLVFTSIYTGAVLTMSNVWVAKITPASWAKDATGDYVVEIESGGTAPVLS